MRDQSAYMRAQVESMNAQLSVMKSQAFDSTYQTDRLINESEIASDSLTLQVDQGRKSISEGRRNLEATITEGKRNLEATLSQSGKALEANITASRLEMRPYVVVKGEGGLQSFRFPDRIAFRADMVNVGKSVAKGVRLFFKADKVPIRVRGLDILAGTNRVFDEARAGPLHAPEDIAPSGTIETLVDGATIPALSPQESAEFDAGRLMFVFAGGAIYRDASGTVQHITEFCYYMDGSSGKTGTFVGCSMHNRIE